MPVSSPEATPLSSATPGRRSRRKLIVVAIGVCVCKGLFLLALGTGVFKIITERPIVEAVIGELR